METDQSLKTFIELTDSIRSRLSTKRTLEKNITKLNELISNPKTEDAEFIASVLRIKTEAEEKISKTYQVYLNFLKAGRLIFKSISKDIKNGYKFTHDLTIEGIENYEKAIEYLTNYEKIFLAGTICFELAQNLKDCFYYEDAFQKFQKAAKLFDAFSDLKAFCIWQSICCLIYSRDFVMLKPVIQNFIKHFPEFALYFEVKLVYFLVDVILNPITQTISAHFTDFPFTDNQLERYTSFKSLCICYVLGDVERFRTIQNLLLNQARLEQYFIINEMEFRIFDKYKLDI